MEMLPTSAIIGYFISTISVREMLLSGGVHKSKRNFFYAIFTVSLVLFMLHITNFVSDFNVIFNFITALGLTLLIINIIFFLFMFSRPIHYLGLILFPLTLLIIFLTMMYGNNSELVHLRGSYIRLHILVSFASYGLMGLAAIQAILLRYQEKKLKDVQESSFIVFLPPIEKMEKLMFELVAIGFIFLTLSLISGAPYVLVDNFNSIEKIMFSLIAWLTFSYLLYRRLSTGITGKKATQLTFGGILFLFVAYLGTKLFFEIF